MGGMDNGPIFSSTSIRQWGGIKINFDLSSHKSVVVQSPSRVWLFATPWNAAQASLPFTISHCLLQLMSIDSAMPSHHLTLCHPLLLLPSVFLSIRVFSSESAIHSFGIANFTSEKEPWARKLFEAMGCTGSQVQIHIWLKVELFFLFYLFLDVLCLRGCVGFSLLVVSGGYSLVVALGLLTAMAYCWARAPGCAGPVVVAHRLGSCDSQALEQSLISYGARAYLLLRLWDLPGSGIEPVSAALAGGFFTTEPLGKHQC